MEMDPFALHNHETTLRFSVAIPDPSDGPIKSTARRSQQLSGVTVLFNIKLYFYSVEI